MTRGPGRSECHIPWAAVGHCWPCWPGEDDAAGYTGAGARDSGGWGEASAHTRYFPFYGCCCLSPERPSRLQDGPGRRVFSGGEPRRQRKLTDGQRKQLPCWAPKALPTGQRVAGVVRAAAASSQPPAVMGRGQLVGNSPRIPAPGQRAPLGAAHCWPLQHCGTVGGSAGPRRPTAYTAPATR